MWHYAERPCEGPLIFYPPQYWRSAPRSTLRAQLRYGEGFSLIRRRMKYWLRMILSWWQRWFKPPQPTADRSRLVGMYLSQANRALDLGGRGSDRRERQEGKFSQKRRRG